MSDEYKNKENQPNDWVICPYSSAHRMLSKRLPKHLLKCRQNHPNAELVICPFDQTHLVPEPEYEMHCKNCADGEIILQYKMSAATPTDNLEVAQPPVACADNWDDVEDEEYEPQKCAQKANVLCQPEGICHSERRQFVKEERKRLNTTKVKHIIKKQKKDQF